MQFTLCVEPVGHEFELSVRGDEGNRSVVLEAGQTNALMEFDVLQFHGFHSSIKVKSELSSFEIS